MADFYAARAGTNAGAPLDGFLTAVHIPEPLRHEPCDCPFTSLPAFDRLKAGAKGRHGMTYALNP